MTDHELDALIRASLQNGVPEPEEPCEPHRFSPAFEKRMQALLYDTKPRLKAKRFTMRRVTFALIAALLAGLGMSMTAVATRTKRVQTFADELAGYTPIDEQEACLEQPRLTYDLSGIPPRFEGGVEIHCGEQTTQFFHDEKTGDFLEFSSYPKIAFRYHLSLPETALTPLSIEGKDACWFSDQSGISYVMWSTPSTVLVLRSSLQKAELSVIAGDIQVYES